MNLVYDKYRYILVSTTAITIFKKSLKASFKNSNENIFEYLGPVIIEDDLTIEIVAKSLDSVNNMSKTI